MSSNFVKDRYRLVCSQSEWPLPRWYFGLDLGQRRDYSAFVALELSWVYTGRCPVLFELKYEPWLEVKYLTRFPLGTPYEELYGLVRDQVKLMNPRVRNRELPPPKLVIDAGGPGPMLAERLAGNLGSEVFVRPVIITNGSTDTSLKGGYSGVPRRTLVSNMQLLMAAQSLKCTKGLANIDILESELLDLIGASTQPAKDSAHDDLAVAAALASWDAIVDAPELLPMTEEGRREMFARRMSRQERLF
ncbi:MAG: hypothetical protein HYX27_23760 [Acidobacteria bacterium]|nr:hypothetical protein [Acidobacteriota bacterium]